MPSLPLLRPIGRWAAIGALAALAALGRPAASLASQTVISSPGSPLSSIYINNGLACQVQASADTAPSFFGGVEPGGCGTFIAIAHGGGTGEPESHHLFGPATNSPGSSTEAAFAPLDFGEPPTSNQLLTGHGTEAEPFAVTTEVQAVEGKAGNEHAVANVVETDSYINGQDFYTTTIAVENLTNEALEGTLYHAGDCFLASNDSGFGAANVPTPGSVACTVDPNDSPPARYMAFTPVTAAGPSGLLTPGVLESAATGVWSAITPTATPFSNVVEASVDQDNGMGLSWPLDLEALDSNGKSAAVSFKTTISPPVAPTSPASASCTPSRHDHQRPGRSHLRTGRNSVGLDRCER